MKLTKILIRLTIITLMAISLSFHSSNSLSSSKVGACGGCGDGFCAPMCGENAKSCPADCDVIE